MKKIKWCLAFFCFFTSAQAQLNQVNIVNFTVKNTLPASPDAWSTIPGSLILTAQKVPGSRVLEPRMVVQIRSNGAVVCGNTPATARPIDPFDVRTFNAADIVGAFSNCHELKEGNYSICVQFFNVDKVAISREVCKEFRVEASNQEYAPPTLITPGNGKKFSPAELQRPLQFRWTPLVPKPKEAVTYRLRVWQLMQGQNGTQAMRSNQPMLSKDVLNNTQYTVAGLLTGPCKPPYLCDFVWNVQALSRDGKAMGNNNGTSETFSFMMGNDIDIQVDSVHVGCCENGIQQFMIIIKNNLANTVKITQLKIDKVNGATANPAISGLAPVLPINIPGSGSVTFTGSIKCIDTAKTIRFFVAAEDAVDNAITETEVETDTLQCVCDPCKVLGVTITGDQLIIKSNGSNEVVLTGTLAGVDPNKIKKITMELVYFNIEQTGDKECAKCAENKEWGNFTPPAISAFTGFNPPILNGGNFGREWTWTSTVQKDCNGSGGNGTGEGCLTCGTTGQPAAKITNPNNGGVIDPLPSTGKPNSFTLPIAVPPGSLLSCCGDKIKICIRYTWWDFCCHSCDIIKCYEVERKPATK